MDIGKTHQDFFKFNTCSWWQGLWKKFYQGV